MFTESNPLNLSSAITEAKGHESLNLFLVEVGLFNNEDPTTMIDSNYVLVASDKVDRAEAEAVDIMGRTTFIHHNDFLNVANPPQTVSAADFD